MLPMREALKSYLTDRPSVQAVFVGTRRTDPHGENLTHFDPTDGGWPAFMRVHPVIDWHYGAYFRSQYFFVLGVSSVTEIGPKTPRCSNS